MRAGMARCAMRSPICGSPGSRAQASGDIVVVAIDAPSIEKIGVWPWPRRLHAELLRQLRKRGRAGHRLRRRFQHASDRGLRRDLCRGAARAPAARWCCRRSSSRHRSWRSLHINRPLKQFSRPFLAGARQRRESTPTAWSAAIRSARSSTAQFMPSMAAVLAGQYANTAPPFLIDFSIRAASIPSVSYVDVLRGDAATLQQAEGQEGHRRRHRARTRRPLQRAERRASCPGPVLQALAAESLLQNRALHWTSEPRHAGRTCVLLA